MIRVLLLQDCSSTNLCSMYVVCLRYRCPPLSRLRPVYSPSLDHRSTVETIERWSSDYHRALNYKRHNRFNQIISRFGSLSRCTAVGIQVEMDQVQHYNNILRLSSCALLLSRRNRCRMERSCYMRSIFEKRTELGEYHRLVQEMRLFDT